MDFLKNYAEKNNGDYSEERIKETFSPIGKMTYQPKSARFVIDGSKFSVNLNEVGGAIPTAEPFRITLHLNCKLGYSLEICPVSFWERIVQNIFPSKSSIIKDGYIFKSDKKFIEKISKRNSIFSKLQKERVYIRIPEENTSKIILTPANGIEDEAQFKTFITILKSLEDNLNSINV